MNKILEQKGKKAKRLENAKYERLATSVERGRGVAENPWPSDAGLTHFDRSMINFYLAPILAFLLTNVN